MRNLLKVLAIMVVVAMLAVAFVGCAAWETYENGEEIIVNGYENGEEVDNGEEYQEVINENGEEDVDNGYENGDDVVECECEDCDEDCDCEDCEDCADCCA